MVVGGFRSFHVLVTTGNRDKQNHKVKPKNCFVTYNRARLHKGNSSTTKYPICDFHNSANSYFQALSTKLPFGFLQSGRSTPPLGSELEFLFRSQVKHHYTFLERKGKELYLCV